MATHFSVLPGESHGQRSLVGYSPWGPKELDMNERLSMQAHTIGHSISFTLRALPSCLG